MTEVNNLKSPLLCKLGIHRYYYDAAYFSQAQRCTRCGDYKNKYQQQRLEYERSLWDQQTDIDFQIARDNIAVKLVAYSLELSNSTSQRL